MAKTTRPTQGEVGSVPSVAPTDLQKYEKGILGKVQKGVPVTQRVEVVRILLERLLADHPRLKFEGIGPSSFTQLADGSGSPMVAKVVQDGYLHNELHIYAPVLDQGDAAIVAEMESWKDR